MNNFELNKAIAKALGLSIIEWNTEVNIRNEDGSHSFVDYCNNWNDLMPLVIEHKIHFRWCSHTNKYVAMADTNNHHISTYNENPQRALAECLLKVLESK